MCNRKPTNALVMMALDHTRGMTIIVLGGEDGEVHFFNQIKEDFINNTQEMHGHLVKVILGMGNQVSVGSVIINAIENKVFHDLSKI
jgi:hypothetical protein